MQAVEQLESFRFYTSSLLILYEGKNTDGNSNESSRPPTERPFTKRPSTSSPVDVRMIDFAHSVHSPKDQGPDQGYLFGLKSLIAQLQMLKQDN